MKTTPNYKSMLQKLFLVLSIFFNTILFSQTYPVQVNTQLIPPYSLKVSDYGTTSSQKLFVNVLLTDVNEVGRRVKLKMYIEGQGLAITTSDVVVGELPVFLDGGINLRLSNLDLQSHFQLNNLQGITPQQYNTPLPNGGYDFCFEVFDYFTGRKLSAKSCTTVYLLQNDPPILNLPFRDNIVNATNPQNILFTWTPRHSNATNVQYEFTLKELWDTQMNPQAAFLASVPFYQTTTYSTTLLVGPAEPQLIPGKVYGWQVRAFVNNGVDDISVFKNDGKSEIFWFKYLEDCKAPSFVISQALNAQSVKVNWQVSNHLRYQIQYRKQGFGDDDWFEVKSYTNEGTIYNLEPGTTYEFRVGGECTQLSGFAYSNIQQFITPTNDEAAYYNCGLMPEINITNDEPLPTIGINETFTAGDFPVVIREVTGSNGSFSGWGYITLPFLENIKEIIDAANIASDGAIDIGKYTRVRVQFQNVQINTSYQLTQGVVETAYDADWSNIVDADEVIDDIKEIIEDVFGEEEEQVADASDTTTDSSTDENNDTNTSTGDTEEGNTANNSDNSTSSTDSTNDGGTTTAGTGQGSDNVNTGDNPSSGNTSSEASDEVVIVHNGKEYINNDIIEIPYSEEQNNVALLLKNYPKEATINWQVFKSGTEVTANYVVNETTHDNLGINMKSEILLGAKANYNDKEIKVVIKRNLKDFKLMELSAVAVENEERKALSGEILYFINPTGFSETHKKVKFESLLDNDLAEDEIFSQSFVWSYKDLSYDYAPFQANDFGVKTIERNLPESDNVITTTLEAGYPEKNKKSIDVKWIDKNSETKSLGNKLNNILKVLEILNTASEKIGKVAPCTPTTIKDLDTGIKFQWANFNKEDENSRHVVDVERFEFSGSISDLAGISCKKELSIEYWNRELSLGKISAGISCGLSASIKTDKKYYHENGELFKEEKFGDGSFTITGSITISAGPTIKDENGDVLIGVEGAAGVQITGGGKVSYPYSDNDDLIAFEAFLNPLQYSFNLTVKLGPLDKSFPYSGNLWDTRLSKEVILNTKTGTIED
ncbi:fibronectin type III domain-containing protein [Tenacibaculum sp. IB213877]|uniref:fibronectin type III domain-containing protein n=1 Tax=Tenacibaculum sp. IB213877 TaxID=3097351 RepID=UPI002A5A32B7|nr:fibronectin type III domain-containing protein [Tenacibaculum sp. IB213877]MDY0779351.1 fibronectin type III domain-containing protein [Tenacibaculum sp. IB213877]